MVAPGRKPVPFAVRPNAGEPCAMLEGVMEIKVIAFGRFEPFTWM